MYRRSMYYFLEEVYRAGKRMYGLKWKTEQVKDGGSRVRECLLKKTWDSRY